MSEEKSIDNQIVNMLTTLNTLKGQIKDTSEESRNQQSAAASLTQRLIELKDELRETELEHSRLQKQMASCANNDEQLLEILMQRVKKLGCNIRINRNTGDNRTLYRIDYTNNRHLILRVEDGQLSLLEMSPTHPNFASIKKFFSETQDLIGLLSNFGNTK